MTKATRVLSTPPTNTPIDTTRRQFIAVAAGASVASVGTLAVAAMPAAAPVSSACAAPLPTPDAELIELGAKFEPLVDRYYVARKRWARAMETAHADLDREFGPREDRDPETPEIRKAFEDSRKRCCLDAACEALHAVFKEMTPLANAINAASVSSIEGFRAKALVAFWEVEPLASDEREFSFDDAYPFQRLFTAAAELCGLTGKMAATGYALPDIGIVEAAPDDDDADDEGEEA
jgi:hypothetical protein